MQPHIQIQLLYVSKTNSISQPYFRGPSTGEKNLVIRQGITLLPFSGGSNEITFYIKPDSGIWRVLDVPRNNYSYKGDSIGIDFSDMINYPEKLFYIVALQDNSMFSSKMHFLKNHLLSCLKLELISCI